MNKNKIKMILGRNKRIYNIGSYIYVSIFNHDRLEKNKCYGDKNSDKRILLIRPNTEDGVQGLMSLFVQTMRWIEYSNRKGMIPFVDFKNYMTQYSDGTNIWECFFTQPSNLTIEEVYSSKNVILSGTTLKPQVNTMLFRSTIFFDRKLCGQCYDIIWNNIRISDAVEKIVAKENNFLHVEHCIGAYLRGTDYVQLKPAGEYMQPTLDEFIKKLDEFVKKYPQKDIFLVTEDYTYYCTMKEQYGDKIKIVSFDSFVKNYSGQDYLSKAGVLERNPRKRGMEYLVKMLLLSRCESLVTSITMGSIATYALNGGNYKEKYVFDLGVYH